MKWIAGVLLAALFACGLFVAWALLARVVIHGPVDGRSLFAAVEDESGSAGALFGDIGSRCERTKRARTWTCTVADSAGSGGVRYVVRVRRDSSCWDGRAGRQSIEGPLPRRISGCVYRWQWSLLDLLG